ncbi:uncharacterized protein HMPREF1541_01149 [Cyphellophora europaea CBS 101466]|uniref:DJ-1/PfpI domain-containing protein n=1 Tax=Cyphellophora europaea (strain CBS 101466) TaxID=1220924 RepID=W2SGG4_CYPE1|nr:uncharacterized protein HMPREF1541_01149 [Cyphellophora europaea CBS 101466]ETN46959.1 hypothetical protein HMPREF1541_01149 [Cyphellophora europaea CBS 101466]
MASKAIFLMSDYGHDPTETAIPWRVFRDAGLTVSFATEAGKAPACDSKMLTGWTGTLLGANQAAKAAYEILSKDTAFRQPLSWTAPGFSLVDFDLVFLPGGHERSVRQLLDSAEAQKVLVEYFETAKKPSSKVVAAICHGTQVLANATRADGKSVLHECDTTGLPGAMEQTVFHATRLVLGDYYKTYGAGSDSVQTAVTKKLREPSQFKSSLGSAPFIVEDATYNYLSGRFPPDSEALAKRAVELLNQAQPRQR